MSASIEPTQPTEALFEEWVAHPDKWAFASAENRTMYASRPGWWSTDWRGTHAQVTERKRAGLRESVAPPVEQA